QKKSLSSTGFSKKSGSNRTERTGRKPGSPQATPSSAPLKAGDPKAAGAAVAGDHAADGEGIHLPESPARHLRLQALQKVQGESLHIKQNQAVLLQMILPQVIVQHLESRLLHLAPVFL